VVKKKNTKPRGRVRKPESIESKVTESLLNAKIDTRAFIHSVSLLIGPWKKLFEEHQYKNMIARALNNCTCDGVLKIVGYLITKTRVCLVLEIEKTDINNALMLFYDSVGREIRQYREQVQVADITTNDKRKIITIDESHSNLFTRYPLVNDHLVKLITGRRVELSYYDPHLASLKDKLRNSDFCSARDYSGAEGPVIVKLLTSIYGIDISKYQGDEIDFLEDNKDSLSFVVCKATEGINLTDPDFSNNWKMIKEKGFIRGAYHFYHCGGDTILQARNFLSALDSLAVTDLPPIIDFEEAGVNGCPPSGVQTNLLGFLRQVEKKSGRIPIIYTDNNTANNHLTDPVFAKYPLYIADYSKSQSPIVPNLWKVQNWAIWQKTDSLKLDGNYYDFDVYNGHMMDLKNFIKTH
jgi:lysozyme